MIIFDFSWSCAANMNADRVGFTLLPINGELWAIGGTVGKNYTSDIEIFNPEVNSWSKHSTTISVKGHTNGCSFSSKYLNQN